MNLKHFEKTFGRGRYLDRDSEAHSSMLKSSCSECSEYTNS